MAHHSDFPLERNIVGEQLGATGQFPEGKLVEHDEGEIRLAIGHRDGKVVMEFGTSVKWIGFTYEQARDIARLLGDRAALVETEQKMQRLLSQDKPPGK